MATSQSSFSSSDIVNSQHKDTVFCSKYTQTLKKVRCLFGQVEDSLLLVDIIQRLALDHHFSKEIGAVLRQLYATTSSKTCIFNDLYKVSLSFRLLRQAGFHVTQDLFTNFMDETGKFKKDLSEDTKGLLALYEASHVGLEGEDILDEATTFSSRALLGNLAYMHDDGRQCKMVKYYLQNPHHKSIAALGAKNFLENVVCENKWENLLQDLAKMELIMVESLFQEELLQVVKWWNGLGLTRELKSARNQPMKWHKWSMAVLDHDRKWSSQRIMLTKPISLVYIVDDIFDLYATLDQLTLFTQTVKRWEISETEGLPDYMKMCFKAIQETTEEISDKVYQEHRCTPLETLKRSWGTLFEAFLREAKWFDCGELPKADEYLNNGIVSSGVPLVLSHLFFIMCAGSTTKETQELLNDAQCILYSVAKILRLVDDLGSAQDENQDGHDGSYVECYMKEFDVSSEIAKKHVVSMISETWRGLNKQCLFPSLNSPPSFTKACLNAARMVPIMYNYDENRDLSILAE